MKRKLLLAILLGVLSFNLNAQDTQNPCKFDYTVEVERNPEGFSDKGGSVNFKWNITKMLPDQTVSIEIVKIYDCFKEVNGIQTEIYTLLNLNSKDLINKNFFKIKHVEMVAKCFKWRVVLKSNTCTEETDWNYYSFID